MSGLDEKGLEARRKRGYRPRATVADIAHADLLACLAYDPLTGLFMRRFSVKGGRAKAGQVAGTVNGHGYIQIRVMGKLYAAHRLAWFYMTEKWPKDHIDHIDTCRSNNSFSNLREATNSQNQYNSTKPKHNTSGFKGVYWHKRQKIWIAYLNIDGKDKILGRFEDPEEAYDEYCRASYQYRGEFARVS